MILSLSRIKSLRTELGISQQHLSRVSGVSQSLIAKIENGQIEPTFSNALRLISALESMQKSLKKTADEIKRKSFVYAEENENLYLAIKKIRKSNSILLPVLKNNKCIGLIDSVKLIDTVISSSDKEKELKKEIKKLELISPVIIPPQTSISLIIDLLKETPVLIVQDKDSTTGIITIIEIAESI